MNNEAPVQEYPHAFASPGGGSGAAPAVPGSASPPAAAPGAPAAAAKKGRANLGDIDMRIDREGVWFYHGSPIGRKELVRLFASVLRRDDDGRFWLVTPAEQGRIRVEDAPFLAVELFTEGSGREQALTVRTNVDTLVAVDDQHPLRVVQRPSGEPRPYVTLRPGIEARLTSAVFYQLAALAVPETEAPGSVLGVWSRGSFYPLGPVDDD